MKFQAILAGVAALWLAAPAHAADGTEKGTLSILFENDIFDNTDHDYTNGVLIGYTTAPDDTPDWAVRFARALPFFAQTGDVRTRYALGQDIFTPNNLKNPNPPPGARPYAGFLYGSFGLVDDNADNLDQLQIALGVVGPASLAEDTQKFVHAIIHGTDPQGWPTQLRDEPGLIIQYERSLKLIPPQSVFGLYFDAEPHYGIAIGNIYDYVNIGGMARLGINIPKD
ncbi:MAG TPA: lipid A deacylase LpxR family protein, partial [Rhizomicrobium sp.]|nr:lipid A deacylase LpxR family protein [Rhizomicrobium sp.]